LAAKSSSETTKWLTILGNTALRTVFETALGLPKSIGTLDLDQQLNAFQEKAATQLGSSSISQFSDPAALDKLTKRYLLRAEVANLSASTGNNSALQLMQQIVSNGWVRNR